MHTSSQKRFLLIGLGGMCLLAGIALAFFSFWPRIRILDKRFHVVSMTAARGTNQVLYIDNQLMGRVRERLAKLGIGIKPAKSVTFQVLDERNMWVSVVYHGDFSQQELTAIEAELVNSDGKVFRIYQGIREPDPKSGKYLGAWLLDFTSRPMQSTNRPNFKLRLRLPNKGAQLAEIPLGALQR